MKQSTLIFADDKKTTATFNVQIGTFKMKKKNKNAEKTYCKVRNVVEKVIKRETDN